MSNKSDKEELEKLKRTFEEFIASSSQLQMSYQTLQEESQRLSLYLSNMLENMNSAIMVFDNRFNLNLWNGITIQYFPHLKEKRPPLPLSELASEAVFDIEKVLTGKKKLVELEVKFGDTRKWLEIDSSDFMNNKREKTGYLVLINDKTELKRLQIKSQQEDRLRVMGELAAEVAHEIRNPLGSIELMVTLLQEDLVNDQKHNEVLSRIRTSVDNMNHIVTNILLYTREIHPERSQFPIMDLVEQAEHIALNTIVKKQITVEKQLGDIIIDADLELLKQSLANILINAAQAVDVNGRIDISTEVTEDQVQILVRDNGCGIPEDVRDNVFKPFFTTKNTGTGLGLAMVKRVIEAHCGSVNFQSDSTGTVFVIQLPIS
jgi:signal transduction histidine kinase